MERRAVTGERHTFRQRDRQVVATCAQFYVVSVIPQSKVDLLLCRSQTLALTLDNDSIALGVLPCTVGGLEIFGVQLCLFLQLWILIFRRNCCIMAKKISLEEIKKMINCCCLLFSIPSERDWIVLSRLDCFGCSRLDYGFSNLLVFALMIFCESCW